MFQAGFEPTIVRVFGIKPVIFGIHIDTTRLSSRPETDMSTKQIHKNEYNNTAIYSLYGLFSLAFESITLKHADQIRVQALTTDCILYSSFIIGFTYYYHH